MQKIKMIVKSLREGQQGFTLIELLVVVAILGILAAVAVPSVSKFIGTGDDSAAAIELRDVQAAVTAMIADCNDAAVNGAPIAATADMSLFVCTDSDGVDHTAAEYMTGLDGTLIHSGHTYSCDAAGVVAQVT